MSKTFPTSYKIIVVLATLVLALALVAGWALRRPARGPVLVAATQGNLIRDKFPEVDFTWIYPGMGAADVDALQRESLGLRYVYSPFVEFAPLPTTGRFLNIEPAGYRRGSGPQPWPPAADELNVFVFGGSTTLGFGLPDDQTLVSALEESLGRRYPGRVIRCYNFGRGYYYSTQERLLFESLLARGFVPDAAFFIDGLNDFAYDDDVPQYAGVLFGATAPDLPAPARAELKSDEERVAAVKGLLFRYANQVKLIEAAAKAYGVIPVFIGQPTPFADFPADPAVYPFKSTFREHRLAGWGYVRFKDAARAGRFGRSFVWCGDAFIDAREPVYADSIHYSPAGAKRLAQVIVERVLDAGLLPRDGR